MTFMALLQENDVEFNEGSMQEEPCCALLGCLDIVAAGTVKTSRMCRCFLGALGSTGPAPGAHKFWPLFMSLWLFLMQNCRERI